MCKLLITWIIILLPGYFDAVLWGHPNRNSEKGDSTISIYIISKEYHSSIIIPMQSTVHDWEKYFSPHMITYRYLELAWGDRKYYMASRFDLGSGLRALLLPTPSVMHVVSFPQPPREFFLQSEIGKINLPVHKFEKMLDYIRESFAWKQNETLKYLKPGIYGASGFFASPKIYHGLFNCNNWVYKALRKAGIPTPVWGGFPVDVTPFNY